MSDAVTGLPEGGRVVLRRRLDPGERDASGASLTDVVGTLVEVGEHSVVVSTRRGVVRVERASVVAAKEVPPRPVRRGAPHLAIGMDDLQRVMVDGWPPLEREPLGQWLLRASEGFTNRGNSVMTAGSPGCPTTEAVDRAQDWYAARGLRPAFALYGPEGFVPDEDELGRELLARGYGVHSSALVMTAATTAVAALAPSGDVARTAALEPEWLEAYARQRTLIPGATEGVLQGSPLVSFGSIRDQGEVVAVARLAVAAGWAGISAVWVDPGHRRRGLARQLTAALCEQAAAAGARSVHLQVESDNRGAIGLYRGMGFATHHAYAYLSPAG